MSSQLETSTTGSTGTAVAAAEVAESELRATLIETAVDCLGRFGYTGTTVNRVAGEAGCTKGAVYWYFRDKDALVAAALDSVTGRWLSGLQDHLVLVRRRRHRFRADGAWPQSHLPASAVDVRGCN